MAFSQIRAGPPIGVAPHLLAFGRGHSTDAPAILNPYPATVIPGAPFARRISSDLRISTGSGLTPCNGADFNKDREGFRIVPEVLPQVRNSGIR